MVPSPDILKRFSIYLLRHKPSNVPPVTYPGYTAITDLDILIGENKANDQLSISDIRALSELKDDLFRLCSRAQERGVRVMVDAEYRWDKHFHPLPND